VLQEQEASRGYLVALDPTSRSWALVMRSDDTFTLVSGLTDRFIYTVVGM
jgi:hypothetical protein